MIAALVLGALAGAATIWLMWRVGMLRERSGLAVLVAAVAVFYPVFTLGQGDLAATLLHLAIFLAFTLFAIHGFRQSSYILAGGLIGHGLFDITLLALPAPGPVWWPAACAAYDVVAGLTLVRLIQIRLIPQ